MAKTEHVLEEMGDEEFDSLRDIIAKVFRACNGLEHQGRAVPTYNFVRAAEKAGYSGPSIRAILSRSDGIHAARFSGRNSEVIACWYEGSPDNPPTERAPRVPRTIRLNREKTRIYPDKVYRLNGEVRRGIELIKAYDAGELA